LKASPICAGKQYGCGRIFNVGKANERHVSDARRLGGDTKSFKTGGVARKNSPQVSARYPVIDSFSGSTDHIPGEQSPICDETRNWNHGRPRPAISNRYHQTGKNIVADGMVSVTGRKVWWMINGRNGGQSDLRQTARTFAGGFQLVRDFCRMGGILQRLSVIFSHRGQIFGVTGATAARSGQRISSSQPSRLPEIARRLKGSNSMGEQLVQPSHGKIGTRAFRGYAERFHPPFCKTGIDSDSAIAKNSCCWLEVDGIAPVRRPQWRPIARMWGFLFWIQTLSVKDLF